MIQIKSTVVLDILTHRPQDWILPDSIRLNIILISARLGLHSESLLVTVRICEDLWLSQSDPQLISSFRINSSTSIYNCRNINRSLFVFLCRDFSPALFNSAPILPSGSSMSNQLSSQLSSDSSPGPASSLGLRPSHDPMLTSPPPNSAVKGLEDNKDGYKLISSL